MIEYWAKHMKRWTLLSILLTASIGSELGSFADDILAHDPVAGNDHFIVLAYNEEERFHFSLTCHQASPDTTFLDYTSFGIESVRRLSVAAKPSSGDLIELVFIGGLLNSTERTLFHAKLRWNRTNKTWSTIHSVNTSITWLSSSGFEPVLELNPAGTLVIVLGDQAGYLYNTTESRGYNWSAWVEGDSVVYPEAIGISEDNYLLGCGKKRRRTGIVPTCFEAYVTGEDSGRAIRHFEDLNEYKATSFGAPISIAVRGSYSEDDFTMAIGFPSADSVYVSACRTNQGCVRQSNRSPVKGINFGASVIFTDNETYGVLSTTRATPPWSMGRVEVRCFFPYAHGEEPFCHGTSGSIRVRG